MISILLVDDQNLVQQGIKSLLEQEMDFKVIGTVKDGKSALEKIAQTSPNIVLLDIEMPGMNGIMTTKYINRICPETKVIILSSHEDKKYVTQALMAGAKGYLLKNSLMRDLKQAIIAVANGYSQIDSRLLAKVFDPRNFKIKTTKTTPVSVKNTDYGTRNNRQDIAQSSPASNQENTANPSTIKANKALEVNAKFEQRVDISETSPSSTPVKNHLLEAEIVDSPEPGCTPLEQKNITVQLSDERNSMALQTVPAPIYPNKFDYYSNGKKLPGSTKKSFISSLIHKTLRHPYFAKFRQVSQPVSKQLTVIKNYVTRQANHPRWSKYQPFAQQLQSQFLKFKNQLRSIFKQKQQRDLVWNLGLIALGAIMVIILA